MFLHHLFGLYLLFKLHSKALSTLIQIVWKNASCFCPYAPTDMLFLSSENFKVLFHVYTCQNMFENDEYIQYNYGYKCIFVPAIQFKKAI